ncbi:MAG: general secretion pathway protein GspK [Pseudomonadota bacterium]|nr:general secretion pathway protein GspK [Pseudomonadota bacterium]
MRSLRHERGAGPPREGGIALVLALWITILLTSIATSFAFSMRSEALAARNAVGGAQAQSAADGAVERIAFELQRPRNVTQENWNADGRLRTWRDGDVEITAVAIDESAKIDLNSASQPLLSGLLQNLGGLSAEDAQAVLDAILDWRDPDDLRRPNGAEESDYRAAGRKYKPANGPFEAVGELRLVLGVTPALYDRVAPALTVFSRQAGINPGTASRDVLLALPGTTPELVDAYLTQRHEALEQNLPVPPFAPAQAFATGAIPVWRIHAEARLSDGVTFVRDAVVRPTSDPKRGLVALLWQEGIVSLSSNSASVGAANNNHGTPDR